MATKTIARPLEGKFAIVTGASRGIGAAIAHDLGAKGANILATYTSDSSTALVKALCSELESTHGVRAAPVQSDLADSEISSLEILEAANAFFSKTGGELKVDILTNNAGVGGDYKLGEVPVSEFHRMYGVNVLAPLCVDTYIPAERSARTHHNSTDSGIHWPAAYTAGYRVLNQGI